MLTVKAVSFKCIGRNAFARGQPKTNTIMCKTLAFYDNSIEGINIFEQGTSESC